MLLLKDLIQVLEFWKSEPVNRGKVRDNVIQFLSTTSSAILWLVIMWMTIIHSWCKYSKSCSNKYLLHNSRGKEKNSDKNLHIRVLTTGCYRLDPEWWVDVDIKGTSPDSGALTLISAWISLNFGWSLSPTSCSKIASLVVTIAPACWNLYKFNKIWHSFTRFWVHYFINCTAKILENNF